MCFGLEFPFKSLKVMRLFEYKTDLLHWQNVHQCLVAGSLPKPQITLSPGPEVSYGERVEITCMMITEHLGGTFVLQKTPGTFRLEKYTDNDAAVFVIPKAEYSHGGSYHCEYRKRLATQNIEFPLGDAAQLSVTGQMLTTLGETYTVKSMEVMPMAKVNGRSSGNRVSR